MALLIRLTRTAQDEATVTYAYGPTWEDQPGTVVIELSTGRPQDPADPDDRLVAGWVVREQRTTGQWVPQGQIVS